MNAVQLSELPGIVVMYLLSSLSTSMLGFSISSFISLSCLSSSEHCSLCICKVALILSGAVFDTGAKREAGSASFLALELLVSFCLCSFLEQLGHCWLRSSKTKHSWVLQKSLFEKEIEVDSSSSSRESTSLGMT